MDGTPIGRFVYSRFARQSNPDLSVFEVRAGVAYRAAMCMFGGPTSLLTGALSSPSLLLTYGHGENISLLSRGRAAVAPRIPRQSHVQATGLALQGDSGSGVETSDGQAVGILTDLYVAPTVSPSGTVADSAGTIGINRLDVQLPIVESRIHRRLTLLTAPVKARPADDCA